MFITKLPPIFTEQTLSRNTRTFTFYLKKITMDKTGKVKSLNSEIKKLEKLKEEIQNECRHKNTYLKFEEGSSTIRVYCRDCEKQMGVPSPKDVELFLSGK